MKNNNDIRKKVLAIKRLDPKSYEMLDLDRLVVFGMFYLEHKKVPLYFEYIVVGLFRLFPKKFSMANFRQYPDADRMNNAVRRIAGGIKSRGTKWANGSIKNGFTLTETGREIAKQVEGFIANPTKQIPKKAAARSRGRSPIDDITDVRNSLAFKKWEEEKDKVTNYDIFSLLGAMPYAPKNLLKDHIGYLKESAATVKDKKITTFLEWVELTFRDIFN